MIYADLDACANVLFGGATVARNNVSAAPTPITANDIKIISAPAVVARPTVQHANTNVQA